MFAVIVSEKGGGSERHDFNQSEVTVGRVQGNDIILPKGNVSKRHSRIVLKDGRFIVVDLKSTNGTYVNGRKVTSPLVVKPGDKIYIGDFTLSIEGSIGTQSGVPARQSGDGGTQPPDSPSSPRSPLPPIPPLGKPISQPAVPPAPPTGEAPRPSPKTWEPPKRERAEVTSDGISSRSSSPRPPIAEVGSRGAQTKHTSAYEGLANVVGDRNLHAVMTRLEVEIDVHDVSAEAMRDEGRWTEAERAAERIVQRLLADGLLDEADGGGLAASALREAVGFGALEALLADDRVREILVTSPSQIDADYGQGLEPVAASFSDARSLMTVLRRLASSAGAYLDKQAATHSFLLGSGAHVTVLMPPMSLLGPVVEIRRVHRGPSLDELAASHALSVDARAAIVRGLQARKSLAVVGPAGSGVTTTLAAIASALPLDQRLVVASAEPDLRLERPHVITLSAGVGSARMRFRDVIEQALRLRSDHLLLDGLTSDDLRFALCRLAARAPGDLLGIRMRPGDSPLSAMRRLLELGGAAPSEADALLRQSIDLVVELDGDHGVRRVKRVYELREGAHGVELVEIAL